MARHCSSLPSSQHAGTYIIGKQVGRLASCYGERGLMTVGRHFFPFPVSLVAEGRLMINRTELLTRLTNPTGTHFLGHLSEVPS